MHEFTVIIQKVLDRNAGFLQKSAAAFRTMVSTMARGNLEIEYLGAASRANEVSHVEVDVGFQYPRTLDPL